MEDINKSLQLNDENSYAYKNRALVYLAQEFIDKACEDLNRAEGLGYSKDYDDEALELISKYCQ
jgi:hypothetical protein